MDKKVINDIAEILEDIKKGAEEINELFSAIPESDIKPSDIKRIKTLENLFNAEFSEFREDNGNVLVLNLKNKLGGGNFLLINDWLAIGKQAKKLKIRWIKVSESKVSLGLDSINEY